MEGGGTTLPHLGPVLEERKRATGSRSSSTQPYSARLSRDDRSNYLAREEEAVRAVYKKHAQSFFEEVKDGFLKEAALLRKQAQKAFSKAGVAWDAADAAGNGEAPEAAASGSGKASPGLAGLQAQLAALQRQVGDLQVTCNTRQAASPGGSDDFKMQELGRGSSAAPSRLAGRTPSPSTREGAGGSTLSERVARQQDEIKALSRLVKSEFGAAKKAALTPMWKERALQEIAQGELRAVCADEVGKAFRDFACAFSEREAEAAVTRLCESGATPMESRLRAELEVVRKDFSRQLTELSCRADESTAARAVLADRLGTVEESQLEQTSEIAQMEANLQSMHREGLGDVRKQMEGLREMLSDRIGCALTKTDSVEAKCTALHASLSNMMQTSLTEEAGQRQRSVAKVVADVDALRVRSEEDHRQLKEQISTAAASCADACRQVAQVQQATKDDMRRCSEALVSTRLSAAASQRAAEACTSRAEAAKCLAEEVAMEARGACAGAEQAKNAAEAARAEAGSARKAADGAAVAATQGESTIMQHGTRLNAADARLNALQKRAECSEDRIKTCNAEIEQCRSTDKQICAELTAVIQSSKDQLDRGLHPLNTIVQAQMQRLQSHECQLQALGERVEAVAAGSAAASPRRLPAVTNLAPYRNLMNAASPSSLPSMSVASASKPSSFRDHLQDLNEMQQRGTFDNEPPEENPPRATFDYELGEDALEIHSIADDITTEMMGQTFLTTYGSDMRVHPGGWMDMGREDSRDPSVASMCRSSPVSDI
mmetsp:Transcript_89696/g.155200  ORF Transcript_89696/g.155200 Transcript_89696/m.155200 type:complete len:775 (+) Transcript_89696:129-2453(+)